MEVFIHKITGKGWVLLEDVDADSGYFISPELRKMHLPFETFQEDTTRDVESSLDSGTILKEQIEIKELYDQSRSDEVTDKFLYNVAEGVRKYGRNSTEETLKSIFEGTGVDASDVIDRALKEGY
jgi:hypothetical protein